MQPMELQEPVEERGEEGGDEQRLRGERSLAGGRRVVGVGLALLE